MSYIKKTYFLGAIFFIVMIGLFITAFVFSLDIVEEKQIDKLSLERDNTANEVAHYFHEIETTLSNIEAYILEDNYTGPELLSYLQSISNNNPLFYSIYLVNAEDGSMINSSDFEPGPDFDATKRPWYIEATENDDIIYTAAYLNATEDRLIINVAKAIMKDGQLYGVLSTDIDISSISQLVGSKDVGENGYVFLIDSQNQLIAKPGLSLDRLSLEETDIIDTDAYNTDENGFIKDINVDGENGVLSHTSIANNQYMLFVFMPMNEFLSPVAFLRDIFLIVSAIFLVTTLILLAIYNSQINRPYQKLIHSILKINIDNDPSYRINQHENSDHKRVIRAVNQVLDSTEFYLVENRKQQHELKLENQRVKLLMNSTADIIFEIDTDKRFISVYGHGLKKLQLKSSDFIGRSVTDIFGVDGKERNDIYDKTLTGEKSVYDWQYEIEGQIIYFESSISPVYDEFDQVIGAVGITRDVTEPVERHQHIEHISNHDFLTNLYNRRFFVDTFLKRQENAHYPIGLMMMDLNGLKIFNDAYGHEVGDKVLKTTADVLNQNAPEHAIVARIGGDEFALMTSYTSTDALEILKQKIQGDLAEIEIKNLSISMAIGIHIINKQTPFKTLLKAAEEQMYRNKITEGKSSRNDSIKMILETLMSMYDQERTHATEVSQLCQKIGKALNLKLDDIKELEIAGLYHDIGKITIPESILYKPAELSKQEYEVVQKHVENGYNILRAADQYSNLADYALSHHERYDGKGYPRGLAGNDIPFFSRIICLADAYQAMTSERPYKEKYSKSQAIDELERCSGTQFDPEITKVFIHSVLKKSLSEN
ncbi:MAG TPA: HD domain-containing phosphohydrolase [Candidatus Izemoplasmatales bacterium]|nr:HD domain-containing phosphohydrolase [Candidatus Izemoplasmatales bacterium]